MLCQCCSENPAAFFVTVTNADREVLERGEYCRECIVGVGVRLTPSGAPQLTEGA